MSRAAALAAGRRLAEAGMRDACTIRRTIDSTTNPVTGERTPDKTVLYTGKCRVQQRETYGNRLDAGETSVILQRLEIQLPMSVTGLAEGDEVTMTASVDDPDLVGREFRIHDLAHKTDATARRVQATEATS